MLYVRMMSSYVSILEKQNWYLNFFLIILSFLHYIWNP